ncbi:Cyclic di-GMP phosphodiesterase [Halioglobus japonicus]|nr:Cyclic di-GMP phosphodiesterase [Halioglobus japonicus]
MRLVKLPAMNLEPGMFIAELDRPWLETPFTLQGFVVRDAEEIKYVSNYVDHVYVDAEYTGARQPLTLAPTPLEQKPRIRLALKEEFNRSRDAFERATETLDTVFQSLRGGCETDINALKTVLMPLIDGIARDQSAVAAVVRMQDYGEYRPYHGISMAVWAVILGRQIGLSRSELEKLAVACALCDVGMTQLPSELLDQAENLTDTQRRIIRAHPTMSANLVTSAENVDIEIIGVIENHHERLDGSGYPNATEGPSIPLLARIAGLADAYDAMITPRPYAKARTSHEAALELLDCSGYQFQEALVEQFIQAIGLFPTGSMVELNTGEVAIITSQNITRRLKPELMIVMNGAKARRTMPKIVDLANQSIAAEGERWIARELQPGTYDITSEEYFV